MKREYHRWFSPHLNREMELLEFGHSGTPTLVFPTRQGRFFDYENWGLVAALRERIEGGSLKLICVDSVDSESLYCRCKPPWNRIERHRQYERYVLDEVLPFIRSGVSDEALTAHGCSIGAYHAVTLALRHPEQFSKVVGLSGRYDLTQPAGPFQDLFDGYYDEDIYFFMPNHFIPGLSDENVIDNLRRIEMILAVGEADPFAGSTRELSGKLADKGVAHTCAMWDGEAHRARYWQQMVRIYL